MDSSNQRFQIAVLFCGTTRDKTAQQAIPQLIEFLDLNQGRPILLLDLQESEDGDEAWLDWLASGELSESWEGSPEPVSGSFKDWPRYSSEFVSNLKRFFDRLRATEACVIVLLGNFQPERRSCIAFCREVDQVNVLVEEGRTPLRKINHMETALSNEGITELGTILIRKRNRVLDWVSELLE